MIDICFDNFLKRNDFICFSNFEELSYFPSINSSRYNLVLLNGRLYVICPRKRSIKKFFSTYYLGSFDYKFFYYSNGRKKYYSFK